jgi:hypothetical protein
MDVNAFLSHQRRAVAAATPGRLRPVRPDGESRPNCAPTYYQGRPASLWISAMKPRRMPED